MAVVDLAGLNAQVDTSLAVMAEAVEQMKTHVAHLTTAASSGDAEAVAAAVERLRVGTDTLAAAVGAARAAFE